MRQFNGVWLDLKAVMGISQVTEIDKLGQFAPYVLGFNIYLTGNVVLPYSHPQPPRYIDTEEQRIEYFTEVEKAQAELAAMVSNSKAEL